MTEAESAENSFGLFIILALFGVEFNQVFIRGSISEDGNTIAILVVLLGALLHFGFRRGDDF